MEEIISAANLTFAYDKHFVLNDVSFTINRGDFVGIIGANGAGKSTLIKLLLGQLAPVRGSVSILGERGSLSGIGYVPQLGADSNSGFPATVGEIVMLNLYKQIGFMRFAGKKHKNQVTKALEMVEMQEYSFSLIGNLSGGQQKRVMIAKALVNQPDILILDEPTTGVDAHSVEILLKLLVRLNREVNITIIIVTHDIDKFSGHISRLLRMGDGNINEIDDWGSRNGDF